MYDFLEKVWIPIAVKFEIPIDVFWQSNPAKLTRNLPYYKEQHKRKQQNIHDMAWVFGQYFVSAIQTGLHGDKSPYIERPINIYEQPETEEEIRENAAIKFREFVMESNRRSIGVATLDPKEIAEIEAKREVNEDGAR